MQEQIKTIETVVYAGRLKNRDELLKSSSGGAFTAISDVFLTRGDAVACSIYNYENHVQEFKLITTEKWRDAARGSKYMQSKLNKIFIECTNWLNQNPEKNLLFVGMGCQADGFRKYIQMIGLRKRVIIVDIICHGSPSPRLWNEYIQMLEQINNGKVSYLTFKDKRNGWKSPTAVAYVNGQEVLLNDYVKVFYNQCALRPSCYECPYATIERKTDMTIGDYWHIEKTIPDFYDPDGNSLFLLHTSKGIELFDKIKDLTEYRLSNKNECWQKNLEHPTPVSEQRIAFWKDYKKHGVEYIMKKYGTVSMIKRIKNKIKKIIGGGIQ